MNTVLTLLICFLPLAACFLYSVIRLRGAYMLPGLAGILAGCAALVPILLLQAVTAGLYDGLRGLSGLLIGAFISSALAEEAAKTLVFFLIPAGLTFRFAGTGRAETSRVFFAVSVTAGLAFGGFETLAYLLTGLTDLRVVVLRLLTAVIFHGLSAGLDGLFVWQFKYRKYALYSEPASACRVTARSPIIYGCLISSVLLHGLYNFFAEAGGWFFVFSLVCIIAAMNRCLSYFRRIQVGLPD